MTINIDLEKFMIWLTGNDKNLVIAIPDEVATAIQEDTKCRHMVVLSKFVPFTGAWHVQWIEGYVNSIPEKDLVSVMTDALAKGNINVAQLIQERMRHG